MLGEIKSNVDADFDEEAHDDDDKVPSLDKLCITRWTIRGKCFEKIQMNYNALMKLLGRMFTRGTIKHRSEGTYHGLQKPNEHVSLFLWFMPWTKIIFNNR